MKAKEFLQQFFILQLRIENRLGQIIRLQEMATRTTSVMKEVEIVGSAPTSRIENAIVGIHTDTEKLADEISRVLDIRNEVAEAISNVKNPSERTLLEFRYLCLFPWSKIAELMCFSSERVFQLHRQALENFRVPKNITVNYS